MLTLGKLDEAQAEFQDALRRRPGDPEVHYNLGLVLQKMGRSEEALAAINAALAANPTTLARTWRCGDALQSLGRIDEAIAQYNEALRVEPRDAETHNNLGSALGKTRPHGRGGGTVSGGARDQSAVGAGEHQPRARAAADRAAWTRR